MEFLNVNYKYILALIIVALAVWIAIIFYRVGREQLIKKADFWKARWKIVLFWFVIAAIVLGCVYLLREYDLLRFFSKEK